jgi:aminopeptidase N
MHSPFTSDLHVVTPAGLIAAAPGALMGTEKLADGRVVTTFHQIERTDNAGFSLAPYKPVDGKLDTGAPLRVYGTAGYAKYLPAMRDLAIDVIATYGKLFVPFAWSSLNVIQVENDFSGGYSPLSGVFMLRDEFVGSPGDNGWQGVVELAAHEYAHQWWGNLVAPQTNADVALSESLAEYSSCFYTEQKLGNRSQVIRDNISYMYQVPAKSDVALGAQGVTQSEYYVQIVYYKGGAVLDMLRHFLGDDVMAKGLSIYATDFGRDFAKIDDLRVSMEKASGQDLAWFFSQWFTKKLFIHAELSGQIVEVNGKPVLRLKVHQTEKALRFVVPVSIDYRAGKTVVVPVDVNAKVDFVTELPLTDWPVRVRFDVQRTQIRQFATGTPADFNLSGLVDGADLVELALRHGRAVVVTMKQGGGEHFFADTSWNELYDLTADGRVDNDDVEALLGAVGGEVAPF